MSFIIKSSSPSQGCIVEHDLTTTRDAQLIISLYIIMRYSHPRMCAGNDSQGSIKEFETSMTSRRHQTNGQSTTSLMVRTFPCFLFQYFQYPEYETTAHSGVVFPLDSLKDWTTELPPLGPCEEPAYFRRPCLPPSLALRGLSG